MGVMQMVAIARRSTNDVGDAFVSTQNHTEKRKSHNPRENVHQNRAKVLRNTTAKAGKMLNTR
jgi:hypothetical protein